jgi:hypothetical protein
LVQVVVVVVMAQKELAALIQYLAQSLPMAVVEVVVQILDLQVLVLESLVEVVGALVIKGQHRGLLVRLATHHQPAPHRVIMEVQVVLMPLLMQQPGAEVALEQ